MYNLYVQNNLLYVQVPATMWLGTEDGTIHVYNCTDNIRIKKNKEKFVHNSPVLHIEYHNSKVYAALGSGEVYIYSRDSSKNNINNNNNMLNKFRFFYFLYF